MAQTIEAYAKQYLSLARTRGLTPNQPITFLFRPNANDQTDVYRVIVSLTEPSFSDTPYNVLWINANAGDPQYLQVLLRTSHVSDSSHRSSWMVITDTANLYKSRQIFRFVVENASDLGIETGDVTLPIANTTRLGTVILKDDPADPEEVIVVSSSDPRMSNDRYPTPHDHDDYPRTMIRLNGEQYVEVGSSTPPQPGYVLAIVDVSPTDQNKYIGRWVKPTANNVDWNSPHLLSLRISLPGNASFISDNTDVKMVAVAEFEDRVVQDPTGVEWSIQANAVGVTISADGTVHAPDLNADVVLTVTARLQDPVYGNWVTTTYDLHIRNKFVPDDALVSVAIIGLDSLVAGQKTTYSMVARYASGASQAVTPNNFVSANDTLLPLTGLQATAGTTRTDTVVKLTGTYITNGQTYTATKDVTVKAQVMTKLEILGADTINSQAEASYTFRVTWSNGTTELVQVDSFSALPAQYTNITGNKVVAKKETVADRTIQLQASYTQAGQTISASKNVVIIHEVVAPFITKLEIVGASSIKENESANYQFIATMSDQTTRSVNPLTFAVDKAQFATIVNKTVTAGSVDKDEPIVLSASYTLDGITKNATLDVVITNVIVVVTLTKIQIIGANTVPQNTQSDYTVLATYSDGHTATITPDEFKLTAASEYATFEDGTLTVGEVNVTSALVTIAAGYTENGVTRNATLTVTLTGTAIVPVAVEVRGADEMNENTQTTLTAWVKMSDNSYVQQTSGVTWSIIQGQAYGSINQSGVLSAGEVTQNQSILVRASVNGLSGDKTVLVKNVIVVVLSTAVPRVPAFAYGDSLGKTLDLITDLTFSDATTRVGAASELTYTLNATGQLWFTLVPPTGNTGWQLRAKQALTGFFGDITSVLTVSATVGTTTKVGTANIVLHGPVDEVVRAQITGADTLTEMMANIYRVSLVMTSGAIIDPRENAGTWSLPVGGAYATLAPAETYNVTVSTKQVTQNQTITLRVENVVYKGQTYSAERQITIIDSGVTVASYQLVGPNQLAINQTGTYQVEFTMSDGSTQLVDPVVSAKAPASYMSFSGNTATAGNVTQNQTFTLVGTVTFMGTQYKPEMAVTVVAAPQTPLSLLITGADSVVGGVAANYKATANLSDGTTPDVTSASTWTVTVKSGTVTPTINSAGTLSTNKVTADAVVTVKASYTLNGVTVTQTKDVTVKPEQTAGEYKPRFGVHAKVTSLAGYDAAFMASLTTALTETGEQFVTCPANTSTSGNNRFFYVAWPKRLGYGYFRDYTGGSYGFAGSWDGAQEFDDFNFVGCAEVTIAGIDYVVWRNDFPFDAVAYVYSITYGSSDPTSGRP